MSRQEYDCCEQHLDVGHAPDCRFAPQRILLEGLVAERHSDLYRENARFKYSIDMLVQMLPAMLSRLNMGQWVQISAMLPVMVDGLARECSQRQADLNEAIKTAMIQAGPYLITKDGIEWIGSGDA